VNLIIAKVSAITENVLMNNSVYYPQMADEGSEYLERREQ
jgi:hypothetical protein